MGLWNFRKCPAENVCVNLGDANNHDSDSPLGFYGSSTPWASDLQRIHDLRPRSQVHPPIWCTSLWGAAGLQRSRSEDFPVSGELSLGSRPLCLALSTEDLGLSAHRPRSPSSGSLGVERQVWWGSVRFLVCFETERKSFHMQEI